MGTVRSIESKANGRTGSTVKDGQYGSEANQDHPDSAVAIPIVLYSRPIDALPHAKDTGGDSAQDKRLAVIDAALNVVADQGLRDSTLDRIAGSCGCSRATLYRLFPGGWDTMLNAIVSTETARLFSAVASSMLPAANVSEALSAGVCEAARFLTGHKALQKLLKDEPNKILPYLAFGGFETMLNQVVAFACPFLQRWVDKVVARRLVLWAARLTISYLLCPAEEIDLADRDTATRIVDTYIVPGMDMLTDGTPYE